MRTRQSKNYFCGRKGFCFASALVSKRRGFSIRRAIKSRADLIHVHVSIENRDEIFVFVAHILNKIRKVQKYGREPRRFILHDSLVTLKSEHGTRKLSSENNVWKCSYDFFKKYSICSHSLATEEFINFTEKH